MCTWCVHRVYHGGYVPRRLPTQGGIGGIYTGRYTPREVYWHIHRVYTHPGRHTGYTHQGIHPPREACRLYTTVTHTGRHAGYTPLLDTQGSIWAPTNGHIHQECLKGRPRAQGRPLSSSVFNSRFTVGNKASRDQKEASLSSE